MIKSGELEKVMAQFEKDARLLPYMGAKLTREAREYWPKQRYYEHGTVDAYFKAYLFGYACGKCEGMQLAS